MHFENQDVDNPSPPNWLKAMLVCAAGTLLGSMVSVLMGAIHYPDEPLALGSGFGAFLMAPLVMTIGTFPTFGFYGAVHATVAVVGMVVAVGAFVFFLRGKGRDTKLLGWMFLGCVLWAHNNHLALCAIMSA